MPFDVESPRIGDCSFWVRVETDAGDRPGITTDERAGMKELEVAVSPSRHRGSAPTSCPFPSGLSSEQTPGERFLFRGRCNGEAACKRDSVSDRLPGRPVTIHLCGLPEGVQLPGRTGRSSPLLGLAPGGVYRADDVTVVAGALLPHRFTLTCDQLAVRRTDPSAVSLCCTCPSGRPNLALASTLPCGVPTFLDGAARTAAITWPPHHCGTECTTELALRRRQLSRPTGRHR